MHNVLKNHKYDSRRRIVLKAGLISFQDTRIGCFVLNISAGGAGLVVESDAAIPFSFDLEIGDERIRRRCLVVWRNDRQIGVAFDLDPADPRARSG
jgi:PilZ domain